MPASGNGKLQLCSAVDDRVTMPPPPPRVRKRSRSLNLAPIATKVRSPTALDGAAKGVQESNAAAESQSSVRVGAAGGAAGGGNSCRRGGILAAGDRSEGGNQIGSIATLHHLYRDDAGLPWNRPILEEFFGYPPGLDPAVRLLQEALDSRHGALHLAEGTMY